MANKKILLALAAIIVLPLIIMAVGFYSGPKNDIQQTSENLQAKLQAKADKGNDKGQPKNHQSPAPSRDSAPAPAPAPTENPVSFGIYELCIDWEHCSQNDVEKNIQTIRNAGIKSVIVTVTDEDIEDIGSYAFYPSKYLPFADWIRPDYISGAIKAAHASGLKVFASINLPHSYWLAKHPDWMVVWSNGRPGDYYTKDYFHRVVPPSRIVKEGECRTLLSNLIREVAGLGFDGIDINDNFEFPDEYMESTDTILYSSYDDFTINKFQVETGIAIKGGSPPEIASFLKNDPAVYSQWLSWRSEQVTLLLKFLGEEVHKAGNNLVFRPHLLTYGDSYELYGIDSKPVAGIVDVMYLMITPEPDETEQMYRSVIAGYQNANPKNLAVSTYLFKNIDDQVLETNTQRITRRVGWISGAGVKEVYFYDFSLAEKGNLWETIKGL